MIKTLKKISVISDSIYELIVGIILCLIVLIPIYFVPTLMIGIGITSIPTISRLSGLDIPICTLFVISLITIGILIIKSTFGLVNSCYKDLRKRFKKNISALNLIK